MAIPASVEEFSYAQDWMYCDSSRLICRSIYSGGKQVGWSVLDRKAVEKKQALMVTSSSHFDDEFLLIAGLT